MSDLLPTYHCFDDALELIGERLKEEPYLISLRTLWLVHGICIATAGPKQGQPYAHGWVEEQGLVWDGCIVDGQRGYYAVQRDEWYAARQVQETTRYAPREALLENLRTGHYGPWKSEYRTLCSSDRTIVGVSPATYTGRSE